MQAAGVVAEFNPFHYGHKYLTDELRKSGITHIMAAMSGNFTQRGEPAVAETPLRVRAALESGVDLVLQLPVPFAVSGAAAFAGAGVNLLGATGIADYIAFGSESGDVDSLKEISSLLLGGQADEAIRKELETGITYAAARENAVRIFLGSKADLLRNPNDILGVEYINGITLAGLSAKPLAVRRRGALHDSAEKSGSIASASEIRKMIFSGSDEWKKYVPNPEIYNIKGPESLVDLAKYETLILYKLRTMSPAETALLPDISEGIENRIAKAAAGAKSLDELCSGIKTKRYTMARIRRILCCALLGITAEDLKKPLPYIRVLGFNERGAEMLSVMKETASLPVISRLADLEKSGEAGEELFAKECAATDIYSLLCGNVSPCGREKAYKTVVKNDEISR
ncbi:MAG: nucleotidyltransferase family protein [Clostridia bacterium]|nr:nucleotidyltransferase family protein [Clostridia bacterium]